MRTITIFEAFAGAGSQFQALKQLEAKYDFKAISKGVSEFYIEAIKLYQFLHYGELKPETNKSITEMRQLLKPFSFSSDNKVLIKEDFWDKKKEKYIQETFPYLYSFVNNNYFNEAYKQHKKPENEINQPDITKLETLPKNIDILTYSFPCQDISSQGKKAGLKEGTKSSLLYEIKRILEANKDNKPQVLVLENVKNLVSKKFKNDFDKWIETLDKLGYKTYWKVINATEQNSVQNRERVFAVSFLKEIEDEFKFQEPKENNKTLNDILKDQDEMVDKTYLLDKFKTTPFKHVLKSNMNYCSLPKEFDAFISKRKIFKTDYWGATLDTRGYVAQKFLIDGKVKIISPKQAFLYMDWPYELANKISNFELISKEAKYKIAGNGICLNVLESIFENIIKILLKYK